jgi:hypothetical protein
MICESDMRAHQVVAAFVVLRCRCGVQVTADSEELAEQLLANHIAGGLELVEEPPTA